jgi:hypothetical protein
MKKTFIFIVSLIGLLAFVNAQNNFPTSNAIWNESVQEKNSYYGLLGDTTINDMLYSKLYQFSDTILSVENTHSLIGYFRNEGQKVFFKSLYGGHADILLYDFGAEVGDTIWHNAILYDYYHFEFGNTYSIITSIETTNNRKIYFVNGPVFHNIWYENIGSTMGVLRAITTSPLYIPPDAYMLNCFKHNNTVQYIDNPRCNKCFCTTNTISENSFSEIVTIFPNPTDHILNIEIPENIEVKSVTIYDIDGKLIKKYRMHAYRFIQIDVSILKPRSYILKIETDNNIFNKLLIKK